MNVTHKKRSLIALFVVVALLHFSLSWIAFMKSELIKANDATNLWRTSTEVLAFPLVYVADAISSVIDLFPVMMVANSLLWGGVVVFIVRKVSRSKTV